MMILQYRPGGGIHECECGSYFPLNERLGRQATWLDRVVAFFRPSFLVKWRELRWPHRTFWVRFTAEGREVLGRELRNLEAPRA
jgi:hypothetical protein